MAFAPIRPARRRQLISAGLCLFVALGATLWPRPAAAQRERTYPQETYFLAFEPYYDGEYRAAAKAFVDVGRSGIRNVEGRWIDSICYATMLGECHYHMGDLPAALEQYEAALALFLAYPEWMLRAEFEAGVAASSREVPIPWGPSTRRTALGHYPDKHQILIGSGNIAAQVQRGGVVTPPQLLQVRAHEINRCTALAMRRRTELLGPAAPHSALSKKLLAALAGRPAPPNHWTQSWAGVLLGLALQANGRYEEAAAELQKGLQAAGQFDHHLSSAALLELGRIAMAQKRYDVAAGLFHEATISAAMFDLFDDMEEGFRLGLACYLAAGGDGAYAPLSPAAAWTDSRGSRTLAVSLRLLAAENALARSQTTQAAAFIEDAQRKVARRDLSAGAMGARAQYLAAHASFQSGNVQAGHASLAAALAWQLKSSRWLFHVLLVDKLFLSGEISDRIAADLFADVLREPQSDDWRAQPMETLSFTMAPNLAALEHWFELALVKRKDPATALEIAELTRRRRFYTAMPMGGRLVNLRWMLEADPALLNDAALRQRTDLQTRYPRLQELSKQSAALRAELRRIPLAPNDDLVLREQESVLARLAETSAAHEGLLHDLALRREPCEAVFPPQRTLKEIQAGLPERHAALVFLAISRGVAVFLISRDEFTAWRVESPARVRQEVVAYLRAVGNFDGNHAVEASTLNSDEWQLHGRNLVALLFNKTPPDLWKKFDELAIVPDGVLWYLPFEALPVGAAGDDSLVIEQVRVRYAPTAGLAVPDRRRPLPAPRTLAVTGKLLPREDPSVAALAVEELQRSLPDVERLGDKPPLLASLLSSAADQLVVLDEVEDAARGPLDWSPLQADSGKPASTLGQWLALPWGRCSAVAFPGFHTAAEDSLKRGGTGDELFVATCALFATGTRTALITRWRPGGQSSYEYVREFMQELPHEPASHAAQRAARLAWATPIDPAAEPRVRPAGLHEDMTARHPFFWAAFMLVDTGNHPPKD